MGSIVDSVFFLYVISKCVIILITLSACTGREYLIREALHLNQNYKPISNMPPKPARRFTSIPTSIGSQGGKQGRGAVRGSHSKEDERDVMPLAQRKSASLPQKRKVEASNAKELQEARDAKKVSVKAAPASAAAAVPESASLISGRVAEVGDSSLRPKNYKQLTLPEMVPGLESFAKPRKVDYLERSRLELPEVLRKRWSRSLVTDGKMFQPKLNILDDESYWIVLWKVGTYAIVF